MKKKLKIILSASPLILGLGGLVLSTTACGPKTQDIVYVTDFKVSLKDHVNNVLSTGQKDQIKIEYVPSEAKTHFTFESKNPDILSVDSNNGAVEALKSGKTTITVTDKNSGISKSIDNIEVNEGEEEFSAFAPKGAPLLAVYDSVVNKDGFEVAGNNTDVPVQLKANKYDYIIFDSVSALKWTNGFTKNGVETTATSNYTYYGLLTAGNFHLVSKTENREPRKGDKILTFMKGQSPDMALQACYKDLFVADNVANIQYVQDVTKMQAALIAGQYNDISFDFFLIAEPALTTAKGKLNNNEQIVYDLNLNDKIKEITNNKFDYIPQAGLFVKNDYLKLKPNYVESYWSDVKKQMNNVYSGNLEEIEKTMNKIALDKQPSTYGFNVNIVKKLQANGANKFGIADPNKKVTVEDINEFLKTVNADFQINQK